MVVLGRGPEIRRMIGERIMARAARIVLATALHPDRDDIERAVVMGTSRLVCQSNGADVDVSLCNWLRHLWNMAERADRCALPRWWVVVRGSLNMGYQYAQSTFPVAPVGRR
jgi:hypothetical protein